MRGIAVLLINLALASVVLSDSIEPQTIELPKDKDITEINKDFRTDDIEEPTFERSAIISDELWTIPVPFALDSSLDLNAKGVILKAMDQFRLKSCIDFRPSNSETYYINIQKLNGCFSYIGQVIPNGQDLSIGQNCDTIAIVEHELLHALGFYHEQSRYDRDEHVVIVTENILEGFEHNFRIVDSSESTTQGVEYDYSSVMHYGQNDFSNGNGTTINTIDPTFQDVIGQRLEMSPSDVLELNLLYNCTSTLTFQMSCSFNNSCNMIQCSDSELQWEMVTSVPGGPTSDHTNLPSGSGVSGDGDGYFMHVSTASGQEGDSAWLETNRMSPKRDCHVQCLQFYYYHSGNEEDQLNIWMREFEDEMDTEGTSYLMGQITGSNTSHWKIHHVSLNATKHFQVEFEVLKGTGSSTGGLSIDDINLSDTECPHVTIQIDDLQNRLDTEPFGTTIYSPRHYSPEGYAYRMAVRFFETHLGVYVQLISGDFDDVLEWPCPYRQVTLMMVDQNPNIQLQMTKQRSFITDPTSDFVGLFVWDNPRNDGDSFIDENNEEAFAGFLVGLNPFIDNDGLAFREFLKGGSGVFNLNFQDINPLFSNDELPCPTVEPVTFTDPHNGQDQGSCFSRMTTTPTTEPPTTTTTEAMTTTTTTTTEPPTTTTTEASTSQPAIAGGEGSCSLLITRVVSLTQITKRTHYFYPPPTPNQRQRMCRMYINNNN